MRRRLESEEASSVATSDAEQALRGTARSQREVASAFCAREDTASAEQQYWDGPCRRLDGRSCRAPVTEAGAHERRFSLELSTARDRRLWRRGRHKVCCALRGRERGDLSVSSTGLDCPSVAPRATARTMQDEDRRTFRHLTIGCVGSTAEQDAKEPTPGNRRSPQEWTRCYATFPEPFPVRPILLKKGPSITIT